MHVPQHKAPSGGRAGATPLLASIPDWFSLWSIEGAEAELVVQLLRRQCSLFTEDTGSCLGSGMVLCWPLDWWCVYPARAFGWVVGSPRSRRDLESSI